MKSSPEGGPDGPGNTPPPTPLRKRRGGPTAVVSSSVAARSARLERSGESALPREGEFDLSGGNLALDFCNTINSWRRPVLHDRLFSFERLVEFGRVTGVLGGDDAARLLELAGKRRAEADGAYGRATEARKRLFWMFAGEAAGERVSPDDLSWLAEIAKPYLRLERAEDACHWRASADGFDAVLAAVLSEAIALLTSTDLNAVRECGGDDCTWLFVDRSRNRSRRWCSMSDCGNVEKARRHYARKKAARH